MPGLLSHQHPLDIDDLPSSDRLIQEHVAIVRDVVARIGSCLPEHLDFGDLAGHGLAALIEAAHDYAGPIPHFPQFARTRVTRQVVGHVTAHVWYRTCAGAAAGHLRDTYNDLRRRLGALPSDAALTGALGTDMPGLVDRLSCVSAQMAIEPREFLFPRSSGGAAHAGLSPTSALRQSLAAIPELERTVLALYYQEDLSLLEVAQVLSCDLQMARVLFARGGLMMAAETYCAADQMTSSPVS